MSRSLLSAYLGGLGTSRLDKKIVLSGAVSYMKLPTWESWKTGHCPGVTTSTKATGLAIPAVSSRARTPGSEMWAPEKDKMEATMRLLRAKVGERKKPKTESKPNTSYVI